MVGTEVLIAVISAVGTSGAGVAVIRWLNDRPKNRAHAEEVWRRINSSALQEADERARRLDDEIRLCEYKVDRMADLCAQLIDDMAEIGAHPEKVTQHREQFLKIKYMRSIDGSV